MYGDLFQMDDDGAPVVRVATVGGDELEQANDAAMMCPGQAISLTPA
jgi:ferredoxin